MLAKPPKGRTVLHVPGPVGALIWEPGNAARYLMQATALGGAIAEALGGSVLVAFASMTDNTFVAHAVSPEMTGHWNVDYVRKKWQRIYAIGDHKQYLAMLLNWALGGQFAQRYADQLWENVRGSDEKVVVLDAVRRRQG